jgi:RNA-directed DNA polymerase
LVSRTDCRPGRSPHLALDALTVGITTRKVGWVLDADIRGFFDALDREWLVKFVEHRVADRRVVWLIQKWLQAGVLEDGRRVQSETGTVQGGAPGVEFPIFAQLIPGLCERKFSDRSVPVAI